jgi:large subunit ribosomal protein L30
MEKAKKEEKKTEKKKEEKKSGEKLAVIRIRNITKSSFAVRDTLDMLKIQKKFTCVVVENTPSMLGMLNKVKDYVTYGEIDPETLALLEQKRANKDKSRKDFHLSPPRGGFERKGIKHQYEQGGALGYRRKDINELIKRMV